MNPAGHLSYTAVFTIVRCFPGSQRTLCLFLLMWKASYNSKYRSTA
jgi:hypothetical protein